VSSMAKRAFVIGDPISHSRSPLIHNHWLTKYGIAGSYEAIHVKQNELPHFLASIIAHGYSGGNVTIPHKEAVLAAIPGHDTIAAQIGAANTIWVESGGLRATNTDSFGFAQNLDDHVPNWDHGKTALVLGAGGAARAILHALLSRGFVDVRIANRTVGRAEELAASFGSKVSAYAFAGLDALGSTADLVVNTTSLGMKGEGAIPLDFTKLRRSAIVTDIVYVPLMTPFLAAAQAAGLRTVDGLGMLLHQARPGFEKWFGILPEVTPELRNLIIKDLEASK
jgi:shikimate dehydrogenase